MQIKSDDYIRNSYWISGSSLPEQLLYRSLIQIFPRAINRAIEVVINTEFDIVIPELKLRIEYSGEYWHRDKEERDNLRREYCRQNKINYVEIIDKPGSIGIEVEKKDLHITYYFHNNGDFRYMTNNIKVIIENICTQFGIKDYIKIDYNQALYEAILFSSKYIFRLVRNSEHEIIGREYIKVGAVDYCVKEAYQTLRLDKISREHLGLIFYNDMESKNVVLTVEDSDNLSNIALSGNSLEEFGMSPRFNITEREQRLRKREDRLEYQKYQLDQREKDIKKMEEEINKLRQQLDAKSDEIIKRYRKLEAAEERFKNKLTKLRECYHRMINRENEAIEETSKCKELVKEMNKERRELRLAKEDIQVQRKIMKTREIWSRSLGI